MLSPTYRATSASRDYGLTINLVLKLHLYNEIYVTSPVESMKISITNVKTLRVWKLEQTPDQTAWHPGQSNARMISNSNFGL